MMSHPEDPRIEPPRVNYKLLTRPKLVTRVYELERQVRNLQKLLEKAES